jgi:hypothetical protein
MPMTTTAISERDDGDEQHVGKQAVRRISSSHHQAPLPIMSHPPTLFLSLLQSATHLQ